MNSAIDHQEVDAPVCTTFTYRAFCAGKSTVTSAPVPLPDATAEPHDTPSEDRNTW
ncbi:hypothetical protein [Kitasatospora fiedleri]|uniref:hypothetical protein n=1 Tax=Kitasatospora fiedleri TaxID=2991545 RepID=UPI00249A70E3|nr:hypothetical protein [Kitasatospora fiedleri]